MARTIFGDILEGVVDMAEPLADLASDAVDYAKDVNDGAIECLEDLIYTIFGDR